MSPSTNTSPAVLTRFNPDASAHAQYAHVAASGAVDWNDDLATATTFASMRDAARLALRLPASTRAYGLPLDAERAFYRYQ